MRRKAIPMALILGIGLALVTTAVALPPGGEGYFVQAKVTRIDHEGAIDFWVTSLRKLPRDLAEESDTDVSQLPKVIATLELKDPALSSGLRRSRLRGSRISLRGKCEDLARAARAPVIQVQLAAGERWLQAKLQPEDRAGYAAFRRLADEVCPREEADEAVVDDPT